MDTKCKVVNFPSNSNAVEATDSESNKPHKATDLAKKYITSSVEGCVVGGALAFLGVPVPIAVKIGKVTIALKFGPKAFKTIVEE